MEIVIKIPDECIKSDNIANDLIAYFECCTPRLQETLESCTVLPKYHGDLIDCDSLLDFSYELSGSRFNCWSGENEYYTKDVVDRDDIIHSPVVLKAVLDE